MTSQTQDRKLTLSELKSELQDFHGTENYYKHWPGLLFTDGIHHLARKVNCVWLITLVASYQPEWKTKEHFQLWKISVKPDNTAVVTMRRDTNQPALIQQELTFTDFPAGEFEWYCINGVMLLVNEY